MVSLEIVPSSRLSRASSTQSASLLVLEQVLTGVFVSCWAMRLFALLVSKRLDWLVHGALGRPTKLQPRQNHRAEEEPFRASPVLCIHGDPIDCQVDVIASVIRLLFSRRPSAIARLVIAIIIDAIQGMCRTWTRSHVLRKISKLHPLRTHANATPTVVYVGAVSGLGAAPHHSGPYEVLARKLRRHRRVTSCGVMPSPVLPGRGHRSALYLNREQRKARGVAHYDVCCNFDATYDFVRSTDARIQDFKATLTKLL